MKKKMLLFGSFSAMVLGAVMVMTPAGASATSGCSSRGCETEGGKRPVFRACELVNNSCTCPLPNPTFNNCPVL